MGRDDLCGSCIRSREGVCVCMGEQRHVSDISDVGTAYAYLVLRL